MGRKSLVTRKRLVAIVDDEKDITLLFRDALQKIKGVSVLTFTDPKIALEHFRTNNAHYVVLLSDFRMPALNGIELIKKIKDSNPFVRTILMTAFEINDELFKDYTEKEIINAFLQKPILLDTLIKEVSSQLHLYELQKR
ncbi:MAG: response regulator [Nitrososphaeraceae archaeon]